MRRFTFSAEMENKRQLAAMIRENPPIALKWPNDQLQALFPDLKDETINEWRRGEISLFGYTVPQEGQKDSKMTPRIVSKRTTAVSNVYKTRIAEENGMFKIIVLSETEGEVWDIPGETYTQAEAEAREQVVIKELQKHLSYDIPHAIKQSNYPWYSEEY